MGTERPVPVSGVGALSWFVAIFAPVAVSVVLVAFRDQSSSTNAAVILVLPVLAAALLGGRLGGVVGAVVAAACFDFFFTLPYYSFTINRSDDVETTLVLLIVGLVVGELVTRTRQSKAAEHASRREVDQARRVAELGAGRGPSARLISIVEREVVELLGARGARFERPPFATSLPRLGHGVVTIGGGGQGLRHGPRNEVELPVWGHGREIGRFVLVLPTDSAGATIPAGDRALAVVLADRLGAVLAAASSSNG